MANSRITPLTTCLVLILLVAACASPPAPAPIARVPEKLQPGANESLAMIVSARGVQIYECRSRQEPGGGFGWAFAAPEADLFDARGSRIGRHYAGPHWEALDGSKIAGTVKERADAPLADAIPWLLLTAKSVLRVNTVGGVVPRTGCSEATAGAAARINYTADYYFFTAR